MAAKPRTTSAPARKSADAAPPDPTTDDALRALPTDHAEPPDMPVGVAQREIASLARLAKARAAGLRKIGITAQRTQTLARFAARLKALEDAWKRARAGVKLTAADRKLVKEAEALDAKMLAGGRWACRDDASAQDDLTRIAEGSGLADTIDDLGALVTFWSTRADERANTKVTDADLARATELVALLEPAAEKEASDADASTALELRNRCFWAADAEAKDFREGGRYAFADEPKIAAKFVSRYRVSAVRRARRKAKAAPGTSPKGAKNPG